MQIRLERLVKDYRAREHRQGRLSAVRDLLAPRYRAIRALDEVSLDVERAEVLGVVGPNGAGKSTLVKTICGILEPTSGRAEVLGLSPARHRSRLAPRIGVVFGQRTQLWWDLPVIDTFRLHQVMYGIPEERFQAGIRRFDTLLGLGELLNRAVRQLSLGQRTRAELALSLLHEPEILFLDEPTIGLDVIAKDSIRGLLREVNRSRGATIILTSHDMDDIETVCDRVIVLDHGRVLFDGELPELTRRYIRERVVRITLARAAEKPCWPDATVLNSQGLLWTLSFDPSQVPAHELLARAFRELPVADVSIEEPGIAAVIKLLASGAPQGSP